jgi:hypothetical protein
MTHKQEVLKVMVSSTIIDLPQHRTEIQAACLRQGMLPIMMEHEPASDAEAISFSIGLVDRSDIYVGVYAHRYGYIPKENNPKNISLTEMEYDRAVERNIPRFIFIMDDLHPITIKDVEIGGAQEKLKTFLSKVKSELFVNLFRSPEDLRANVINSLSQVRPPKPEEFHHFNDIPVPPKSYIAHPYTLLKTRSIIGRRDEIGILNDWVSKTGSALFKVRVLSLISMGGFGKSALTWHWFNKIAPNVMHPLEGQIWWSFYESDASFANFISRALSYVSQRSMEELSQISLSQKERELLAYLDEKPYLIVLDGLERIMVAYARMDAAFSIDDEDVETLNEAVTYTHLLGLPGTAVQSFTSQHRLRKAANPRVGNFLVKLTQTASSRLLISSRLFPAELQTPTYSFLPGAEAHFLHGLNDKDSLAFWNALGVGGEKEPLFRLFQEMDNHPLLIQALAREIANDRDSPGDFDSWRKLNPEFNLFGLPMVQVKSHVLYYSLKGLSPRARYVLDIITLFRMPM